MFEFLSQYISILKEQTRQGEKKQIEEALEKIGRAHLPCVETENKRHDHPLCRMKLKDWMCHGVAYHAYLLTLKEGSKDFISMGSTPEPHLVTQHPSFMKLLIFDHPILFDFWNGRESGFRFFCKELAMKERTVFSSTFCIRIKTQRPRSKSDQNI